jgi:predicted RND superfamily exporter protein
MKLARRKGSAIDTADTVLGVVVGVIVIMALFAVVSWLIGTFLFLVKVAVVGLIVAGCFAVYSRLKGSS